MSSMRGSSAASVDPKARLKKAGQTLASEGAKYVQTLDAAFDSLYNRQGKLTKILEDFDVQAIAGGFREPEGSAGLMIRLNIGGLCRDISKATMCSEHSPTLLGCLLKERWNCLLLKDKDGRVFLDYDGEWVEPILDGIRIAALQSKPLAGVVVRPPTAVTAAGYRYVVEYFRLPVYLPSQQIFPQSTIPLLKNNTLLRKIFAGISEASQSPTLSRVQLEPIRSWNSSSTARAQLFDTLPHGSHALVVVLTATNNLVGFYTDADLKAGSSGSSGSLSAIVSPRTRLFLVRNDNPTDVQWTSSTQTTSLRLGEVRNSYGEYADVTVRKFMMNMSHLNNAVSNCHFYPKHFTGPSADVEYFAPRIIEVYQVIKDSGVAHDMFAPAMKPHPQPTTNVTVKPNVNKVSSQLQGFAVDQFMLNCVAQLNNLDALTNELNAFNAEVQRQEQLTLEEVLFVEQHVRKSFGFIPSVADVAGAPKSTLERIAACTQRLLALLPEINAKNSSTASDGVILHLSAGGRKVCVSRQVVMDAAPNSQLAVRLSGRWTEQADSVDSDGYIFYDLPPAAFGYLINHFRTLSTSAGAAGPHELVLPDVHVAEMQAICTYLMVDCPKLVPVGAGDL